MGSASRPLGNRHRSSYTEPVSLKKGLHWILFKWMSSRYPDTTLHFIIMTDDRVGNHLKQLKWLALSGDSKIEWRLILIEPLFICFQYFIPNSAFVLLTFTITSVSLVYGRLLPNPLNAKSVIDLCIFWATIWQGSSIPFWQIVSPINIDQWRLS